MNEITVTVERVWRVNVTVDLDEMRSLDIKDIEEWAEREATEYSEVQWSVDDGEVLMGPKAHMAIAEARRKREAVR